MKIRTLIIWWAIILFVHNCLVGPWIRQTWDNDEHEMIIVPALNMLFILLTYGTVLLLYYKTQRSKDKKERKE